MKIDSIPLYFTSSWPSHTVNGRKLCLKEAENLPHSAPPQAATPRVNFWTVRWCPNKETCPHCARLFRPITVKNFMWRHGALSEILHLTSFKLFLLQLQISAGSALGCILLVSCHYCNYSCVLVLLILVFESCRYCIPWLIHSFNVVRNFKYNQQFVQNSLICFSGLFGRAISCWIAEVHWSWIFNGALRYLCACWLIKYSTMIG